MDKYLKNGGDDLSLNANDMLNAKSIKGWIKFANSLRLRLAMRISNVDKTNAEIQAKKALANPYGVLEAANEIIQVSGHGYTNPLIAIGGWGEAYMVLPWPPCSMVTKIPAGKNGITRQL